jgi:hypothetical protein
MLRFTGSLEFRDAGLTGFREKTPWKISYRQPYRTFRVFVGDVT